MKVSVLGLGYVGSVTAAGIAASGHDVVGIDVSWEKISSYQQGHVPFYEPGLTDLFAAARSQGNLRILHTSQVSGDLGDVVVLAVGTPASAAAAQYGRIFALTSSILTV